MTHPHDCPYCGGTATQGRTCQQVQGQHEIAWWLFICGCVLVPAIVLWAALRSCNVL